MHHGKGLGRLTYALAVTAILALAAGGSVALGAGSDGSTEVTAHASALSKKQIQKLIKSYVAKHPGPRGRTGATGATGAPGPAGPAGPAGVGVPEVGKFRVAATFGSGVRTLYAAHGVSIEANCAGNAAQSTLILRASGGSSVFHVFEVDNNNQVLKASGANTANNQTVNLAPSTATYPLSGKVEWAGNDGVAITINFLVAYSTPQGDCLMTGSIL